MAGADPLHCLYRRCRHRRRALPGPADRLRLLLRGDNGEEFMLHVGVHGMSSRPPARPPAPTGRAGQAETHAWKGSKVKLLPCPDPQQKVSRCQALISGGALLTLHLLPSVPALSPFLRGKDETSLGTGCGAAC